VNGIKNGVPNRDAVDYPEDLDQPRYRPLSDMTLDIIMRYG